MNQLLIFEPHSLSLVEMSKALLAMEPSVDVTSCDNLQAAAAAVEKRLYDVCILVLDSRATGIYGLINRIRGANGSTKIIVYTLNEEVWTIKHLIALKVNGIVLKATEMSSLVEAVKTVLSGSNYFCPRFEYLDLSKPECCKECNPSIRELEILKHVAQGLETKDIASVLNISAHTVETHRRNLKDKLRPKTPSHMICIAIKEGMISLDELDMKRE